MHPALGADMHSGTNYFHIAYEENNQIKYYYRYTDGGSGTLNSGGDPVNISSNTGFSEHYSPSVIAMGNTARVCWVGFRMVYPNPKIEQDGIPQYKVIFKSPSNPTRWWEFGNNVSSPNINKKNDDTYYAFGWSENLNEIKFADNSLSTVRTIVDLTGQKLQMSNGTDRTSMFCMAYEHNAGAPYYFERSNNLESYYYPSKVTSNYLSSGREAVISKDSAAFYFALGDIRINDQPVDFIEIPDSVSIQNLSILNEYLVTEPFEITNNSSFGFSIQYGINDSLNAS